MSAEFFKMTSFHRSQKYTSSRWDSYVQFSYFFQLFRLALLAVIIIISIIIVPVIVITIIIMIVIIITIITLFYKPNLKPFCLTSRPQY